MMPKPNIPAPSNPAPVTPVTPEAAKPKIGLVALLGRVWLCLAECVFRQVAFNRGWLFGALIVAGLLAFEVFNFNTTEFALSDLLGAGAFLGLKWATVLAFAFCAIDFAGLARLFTPDADPKQAHRLEVWYLTGAWFLGATANAALTWWAVSIMLLTQQSANALVSRETVLTYVPVLLAGLVWVTRICLISTFAIAGPRLFASPTREVETKETAATTALTAPAQSPEPALILRPLKRGRAQSKSQAASDESSGSLPVPLNESGGKDGKFSLN